MPYDITDAKDDIALLNAKFNTMFDILNKAGLIPKDETEVQTSEKQVAQRP